MHLIMPRFAWLQMLLLCCVLLATACSAGANRSETADLQITLMTPTADTLVVQLLDNADQPITDAKVAVEGNMNHAGMAPVFADAVTDDADGTTDGRYQLPFTFSMLGDWILTVTIEQTDGTTITRDLEVTAASDGISGDAIGTMDHSTMDHSTMDHSTMDHSSMAAMVADNIMARAVPMADANGAVYLMLTNGTATDDQLVAVESNIAKAAELHETINDNNVMRMEPRPEGFAIPAGETLMLEPSGKHIMLVSVTKPLAEGDTFTLTLTFAHADPLTVDVPVMGIDADMDHSGHK